MEDSNASLFAEWRVADRQAHLMERALSKASLMALQGDGLAPSEQERQRAHELRSTADDLFQLAMTELAVRAAKLRR